MAFSMGSEAYLEIATLDISPYTESSELTLDRSTDDINVYGLEFAYRLAGIISAALNVGAAYDPVLDDAVWAALISPDPVAWVYGPQGNTVGDVRYSGTMYLSSSAISAPSTAATRQNITCQITGAIARGTF